MSDSTPPYSIEPVTRWRVRRADGTYVRSPRIEIRTPDGSPVPFGFREGRPLEFATAEQAQLWIDALPADPFEGLTDP